MLIYGRPDERIQGLAVTGDVDLSFNSNWLLDGRHGFPVKRTGSLALTATLPTPRTNIDLFAVINHRVEEGIDVVIGKSAPVATITPGAWGADGIPLNAFTWLVAPITLGDSPTTFTVQSSGNVGAYVIGELWAGTARELDDFAPDIDFDPGQPFPWETQLAPDDDGLSDPRRLRGELMLDDEQYADLQAWYQSTRRGTLPTLIIPDHEVNDAWLAQFSYTSRRRSGYYFTSLEIVELQRTRW